MSTIYSPNTFGISANGTLSANSSYYVNANSLSFNLVASPALSSYVRLIDNIGNLSVSPLTVLPSGGNTIEGSGIKVINTNNSITTLTYNTNNWQILENTSAVSSTGVQSLSGVNAGLSAVSIPSKIQLIDVSSGPVSVSLPSSPVFGNTIRFIISGGSALLPTNNLVIGNNLHNFRGVAGPFIIEIDLAWVDLEYIDTIYGWSFVSSTV
jgi:hypothetical protein